MKNSLNLLFIILVLGFRCIGQAPVIIENQKLTVANIGSTKYDLRNNGELRVSSPSTSTSGTVDFTNESAWLILDGVLPSVAIASHLNYILVNGKPAVNSVNIRVTNYLRGCVIIPQSPNFEALTLYKDNNLTGEEMKCIPYKYYKSAELSSFNNTISSFKLMKGYMATFAQNENGTGYSKVFIADSQDLVINTLPVGLNNSSSFVRVFPWRYTDKKGMGHSASILARTLKAGWFYNWGPLTTENSTDIEFVPCKWSAWRDVDAQWQTILDNNTSSHLLGFNEPDGETQANMSLDLMLKRWPKMLESGLRLGSPAVASDLNLLYDFIDRCDALNYRVDFVAMHDYGEGTALAFYNKCKAIHDRTGRPIWIKEFNYGGTWTNGVFTYEQTATRIKEIIEKYDKEGIIERYAIFSFNETLNNNGKAQNRAVFYNNGGVDSNGAPDIDPTNPLVITPLGIAYRDQTSVLAFNPLEQINIPLVMETVQNIEIKNFNAASNVLTWDKSNTGFGTIFIERAFGTSGYSIIAQLDSNITTTYTDDVSKLGFGRYNYRFSTRMSGFANSKNTVVTFDVNPNTIFNVALNKPVVATSVHSAPFPASNAVDGNNKADNATRWVTKNGELPASIEIDLKGSFAISELKFYTGNGAYNAPVTSFVFQYWNGNGWIESITETQNASATYSKTFTEVTTDKVRLNINGTSDGIARFFEIEVYGRIASLGTEDFTKSKFNIYPNPATEIINISSEILVSSVVIYNINSKVVLSQKDSNSVNISSLPKGVYFVKINNTETLKFVK